MAQHGSHEPHRIHQKPRDAGAAHAVVHHERRHKSIEGKYGVIGEGADLSGFDWSSSGSDTGTFPGVVLNGDGLTAFNAAGQATMTISAANGSVTINGTGIITGGTIRTNFAFPSVVMDQTGIRAYNAGGIITMQVNAADGSVTINGTGVITGGTFQTGISFPRLIMDGAGLRAYDTLANQTFNLSAADGSLTVSGTGIITGATIRTAATGARVIMDQLGIRAYNASNIQQVNIDATTGLLQATALIQSLPGSTVPWQTTGFFVGGGNLMANSSAEDPTTVYQVLYTTTGSGMLNYRAAVLADNPVSYWRLGETSGTTASDVQAHNTGTYSNPVGGGSITSVLGTTGDGGLAIQFASGQFITFGNPTGLQLSTGTVECWVKTSQVADGGYHTIIGKEFAFMVFIVPGGNLGTYDWGGGGFKDSGFNIRDGNWHHVAMSFQSGIANGTNIYVDGALILTTTITVSAQTGNFYIAGNSTAQYLAGSVDEATVYNTVLSQARIRAHSGSFNLQYGSNPASPALTSYAYASNVQSALNSSGVLPTGVSASCTGGPLPVNDIKITLTGFSTPAPSVIKVSFQSVIGGSVVVGANPQPVSPGGLVFTSWATNNASLDFIAYPNAFHGGNVYRLTTKGGGSCYMDLGIGPFAPTPGTTRYTFSTYVRSQSATRPVSINIIWVDAANQPTGFASITTSWNTSASQWQRAVMTDVVPAAASRQVISASGTVSGGTFTLSYNQQVTSALNWNATAAQVVAALQALSGVGTNGVGYATGGPLPTTPITVTFLPNTARISGNSIEGSSLGTPSDMSANSASLTGGGSIVISDSPTIAGHVQTIIPSGTPGEIYYVDAIQLEVGDVATAFAPKPDEIVANTVTANMINVALLSAISANLGTVTAGLLTGATIQTNSANPRVVLDSSGFNAYNSSGANTVNISSATGNFTATGGTITGATIQTSVNFPKLYINSTGLFFTDNFGNNITGVDPLGGIRLSSGAGIPGLPGLISWWNTYLGSGQQIGQIYFYTGGASFNLLGIGYLTISSGANPSVQIGAGNAHSTIMTSSGNSSFVQAGAGSIGSAPVLQIYGPFVASVTIGGNSNSSFTVGLSGNMNPFGGMVTFAHLVNGAWMDHCSWCLTGDGIGFASYSIANLQGNTATGIFAGYCLINYSTTAG